MIFDNIIFPNLLAALVTKSCELAKGFWINFKPPNYRSTKNLKYITVNGYINANEWLAIAFRIISLNPFSIINPLCLKKEFLSYHTSFGFSHRSNSITQTHGFASHPYMSISDFLMVLSHNTFPNSSPALISQYLILLPHGPSISQ